jgi:hypothetical protein
MDIHKPKPWHGVREFLKEYVIIVVGVLTALGAEAGVEAMRWAERTEKTEAHLRAELANATVAGQVHIAQEACEYAMLFRLRQALAEPGDDWRPPYVIMVRGVPYGVFATPIGGFQTEGWKNAQADGTANHLPQADQMGFGSAYYLLAQTAAAADEQHTAVADLNSLVLPRKLDPASRTEYLRLISRLTESVRYMATNGRLVLQETAPLGVKRGALADYGPSLGVYRGICDQFQAGKTVIVINPPPMGS